MAPECCGLWDRIIPEQHRAIQRVRHYEPIEMRSRYLRVVNLQQTACSEVFKHLGKCRNCTLRSSLIKNSSQLWKAAHFPDYETAQLHDWRRKNHCQLPKGICLKIFRDFA